MPGRPGAIVIEVGTLTLEGGAQIDNSIRGPGQGGSVTVTASDSVTITGSSAAGNPSRFFGQAEGEGTAGSLTILTPTLRMDGGRIEFSTQGTGRGGDMIVEAEMVSLTEGTVISAASSGAGDAGSVIITAGDLFLRGNSAITTEATEAGGGDISVTARNLLRLQDSDITATVRGGPETVGGDITIDARFVILETSTIRAEAREGRGGNIRITTKALLADPNSQISASSELGIDGTVDIRTPVADLSASVTPLSRTFVQAAPRAKCATRLPDGKPASLIVRGRGSIPAEPDGGLSSHLLGHHDVHRPASVRRPRAHQQHLHGFMRASFGVACPERQGHKP